MIFLMTLEKQTRKKTFFEKLSWNFRGGVSLFKEIKENDLIIAFFPCIRFEAQQLLNFRGENSGFKNWDVNNKLAYNLMYHQELNYMYSLITKLVLVCLRRKLRLIIENPYSTQHYLTRYWCIKPSIIDNNRSLEGDWYKKPTQYWFINCEPENNFFMEPLEQVERKTISSENKVNRSMIHPQYARRFIKTYILDGEENV